MQLLKFNPKWGNQKECMHVQLSRISCYLVPLYFILYFSHSISQINITESAVRSKTAATAAKSFQSCLTLCDPIESSPPGSTIPRILQARTLVWVAISFFNAWKWKGKVKSLSRVRLFATPWTAAYQAPPSMGFSRQAYWNGLPLPSPRSKIKPS